MVVDNYRTKRMAHFNELTRGHLSSKTVKIPIAKRMYVGKLENVMMDIHLSLSPANPITY